MDVQVPRADLSQQAVTSPTTGTGLEEICALNYSPVTVNGIFYSDWSAYLIEHLENFLRQIVTTSYYKEYWDSGMNPAVLEAQCNQWLVSLAEKQYNFSDRLLY